MAAIDSAAALNLARERCPGWDLIARGTAWRAVRQRDGTCLPQAGHPAVSLRVAVNLVSDLEYQEATARCRQARHVA